MPRPQAKAVLTLELPIAATAIPGPRTGQAIAFVVVDVLADANDKTLGSADEAVCGRPGTTFQRFKFSDLPKRPLQDVSRRSREFDSTVSSVHPCTRLLRCAESFRVCLIAFGSAAPNNP